MSDREEIRVPGDRSSRTRPTPFGRDDALFVAGILPVDAEGRLVGGGDVVEQARFVFGELGRILAAAGATFADVVKVTRLPHRRRRPTEDQPGATGVFGAARPASTLVEVSGLAVPGALIEVDAVAALPMSDDPWNAFITRVEPGGAASGPALGQDARRQGSLRHRRHPDDVRLGPLSPTTCRSGRRLPCSGCSTPARSSSARRTCPSSPGASSATDRVVRDVSQPDASGEDDGRLVERLGRRARRRALRPRARLGHGLLDPASRRQRARSSG